MHYASKFHTIENLKMGMITMNAMNATPTKISITATPQPITVLSEIDLFNLIKTINKEHDRLILTNHSKERITQRNITERDVMNFLNNPVRLMEARVKPDKNDVTYWIKGITDTVVIAIDSLKKAIIVITVIKNPSHNI
jgi:response regulator RpfG family c-di-GMP phosphodiesterase